MAAARAMNRPMRPAGPVRPAVAGAAAVAHIADLGQPSVADLR
jgi:hypothetical protein